MSEYTQLGIGAVGVMFLFAYMGFRMLEARGGDRWHQVVSLLLILSSMVLAWTVAGANVELANDLQPTHDITASINGAYLTTVITGFLVFAYFFFRIAFGSMAEANQIARNRGGGGRD